MNDKIVIWDNSKIMENVEIGEFSVIGKPARPSFNSKLNTVDFKTRKPSETLISKGCYIGAHVLIEEGVFVGSNCIIESFCMIGFETAIGNNCIIVHGAKILGKVKINNNCVIGGLVAEDSVIGNNCRVLGKLLHKQVDPGLSWDGNLEKGPIIENKVFIGKEARVIGEVKIDSFVYICSGAIVTQDVPSYSVVRNFNEVIPVSEWPGQLKDASFWV